jgi:hypothetical protein
MSENLPEWASQLPGFDPSRRWWPIVCTGERSHAFELLAIAYARDAWPFWLARGPHLSNATMVDAQGNPNGPVHPELGVREAGSVTAGPCPRCSHTERVPLERWAKEMAVLEQHDRGTDGLPPWFDATR